MKCTFLYVSIQLKKPPILAQVLRTDPEVGGGGSLCIRICLSYRGADSGAQHSIGQAIAVTRQPLHFPEHSCAACRGDSRSKHISPYTVNWQICFFQFQLELLRQISTLSGQTCTHMCTRTCAQLDAVVKAVEYGNHFQLPHIRTYQSRRFVATRLYFSNLLNAQSA